MGRTDGWGEEGGEISLGRVSFRSREVACGRRHRAEQIPQVAKSGRISGEAKMCRGGRGRLCTAPTWRESMAVTIKLTYRNYESLLREGRLRLEDEPCPQGSLPRSERRRGAGAEQVEGDTRAGVARGRRFRGASHGGGRSADRAGTLPALWDEAASSAV